jgi:hypothetical protein
VTGAISLVDHLQPHPTAACAARFIDRRTAKCRLERDDPIRQVLQRASQERAGRSRVSADDKGTEGDDVETQRWDSR